MIEATKDAKKPNDWKVYLNGTKVGVIRREVFPTPTFRYLPGGAVRNAGSPFTTLDACVKSLETE